MNAFMGQSKIGKTKSCVHNLKVSLEELYAGTTRRVAVNRDRIKNDKIVKDKKILEVVIKPGTPYGKPYKFKGEADQAKNKKAGDIVFTLEEKKHKIFKR